MMTRAADMKAEIIKSDEYNCREEIAIVKATGQLIGTPK
jgi:hypothetical protein